jgi:hypothetical protein
VGIYTFSAKGIRNHLENVNPVAHTLLSEALRTGPYSTFGPFTISYDLNSETITVQTGVDLPNVNELKGYFKVHFPDIEVVHLE